MFWIWPTLGLLLIAAGVQDLIHTLFHPSEQGNISEYLTLKIWRAFRRFAPTYRMMVGPLNFLSVILFWSASVVVGFAMIYRPFMPSQFVVAPGMDVSKIGNFFSSVDLSLSSLITVNMGLQTDSKWLQLAMSVEAVLGFAILTASISWLLSVYPVIENRRSLSHEISLLHFAEELGIRRLDQIGESELQDLLFGFAAKVSTIRTEFSEFPITYYFQDSDAKTALAPALFYLAQVSDEISGSDRPAAFAATVLGGAVDDLLQLLESKYLPNEHSDRWSTLQELLKDHGREPLFRTKNNRPSPSVD